MTRSFAKALASLFAACLCLGLAGAEPLPGQGQLDGSILNSSQMPPDIKRVKERGKLVVAQFSGERPLFFMKLPGSSKMLPESFVHKLPDGSLIGGIDVHLAKLLAERLGVGLELKRDYPTFNAAVLAVASNEADVAISKLCPTFERLHIVNFTKPYAVFDMALLANREFLLRSDASLNAKSTEEDFLKVFNKPEVRIAVKANSSTPDQARTIFPHANIVLMERHEDCILAVRDGKADATLNDDFEFMFIKLFDPELEIYCSLLPLPSRPYNIAIAVNPESHNIMGMASEAVELMKIGNGKTLIRQYGRELKTLGAWMAKAEQKAYPFDPETRGKKDSGPTPLGMRLASAATLGLPLLLALAAWISMSKRRRRAGANG